MMKRNLTITVKGNRKRWVFNIPDAREEYVQEWVADGLEIDQVFNTIPVWVVSAGLARPWVAVQDAWAWFKSKVA